MKQLLTLLFTATLFMSCSSDDDNKTVVNNYKNTSWTATDDIAEIIYGKPCTTTIEFLTETTCQEINKRKTTTQIQESTYYIKNDSVFWKSGNATIGAIAVGSVLKSNMGTIAGGKRVYTKN